MERYDVTVLAERHRFLGTTRVVSLDTYFVDSFTSVPANYCFCAFKSSPVHLLPRLTKVNTTGCRLVVKVCSW